MDLRPYELWYEALTIKLIDGFHGVCPLDQTLGMQMFFAREAENFEEWWDWVREDFEPVEHYAVRHIETRGEAEQWGLWDPALDDCNEVVLLVELDAPRGLVLQKMQKLLDQLKRHKRGVAHKRLASVPLYRKPKPAMIERLLKAYRLKQEGKKLWEIARDLELCKDGKGGFLQGKDKNGKVIVGEPEIMQITASRECRKAIALVTNAHMGIFPKY